MIDLKKQPTENERQYIWRLASAKDSGVLDMSWEELAVVFNKELRDEDHYETSSAFRKPYQQASAYYTDVFSKMIDGQYSEEIMTQKRELEIAKIQFRDERNAWQKQNFTHARVNQKLDYLTELLQSIGKENFTVKTVETQESDNDLLIILSDLHIGQCFDSSFGQYNSDIAKDRLSQLYTEVTKIKARHNSQDCYISISGDLVSGSIHKALAITNRENVIEQIKLASQFIASFVTDICKLFETGNVYVTNVAGNHSRIDRKEDALKDERLDDLIGFIVCSILDGQVDNFHWIENTIDNTITELDIRGKKYIGVHGDYDAFSRSGVANLVTMLGYVPYAVLMGHLHTCAVDETNGIKMIRGGSLAGTGDDYTVTRRLKSNPSQMVCVCTEKGVETYYPVELS